MYLIFFSYLLLTLSSFFSPSLLIFPLSSIFFFHSLLTSFSPAYPFFYCIPISAPSLLPFSLSSFISFKIFISPLRSSSFISSLCKFFWPTFPLFFTSFLFLSFTLHLSYSNPFLFSYHLRFPSLFTTSATLPILTYAPHYVQYYGIS